MKSTNDEFIFQVGLQGMMNANYCLMTSDSSININNIYVQSVLIPAIMIIKICFHIRILNNLYLLISKTEL